MPPGTFIPLAEESGLIVADRRMGAARSLPRGGVLAASRCRSRSTSRRCSSGTAICPRWCIRSCSRPGSRRDRLELEITEGVLIDDFSRAVSILRRLKALGVRIAMDDFGTGYSSLSYLQSFPFDKIKIDQTFIANLERNAQSAAIVRAVSGSAAASICRSSPRASRTRQQLAIPAREGLRRDAGLSDRPSAADLGLCRALSAAQRNRRVRHRRLITANAAENAARMQQR